MKGRTVLVTGGTDGIGKQIALTLAGKGATIILHGRNPSKTAITAAEIRAKTGNGAVETAVADFTSLAQVRACADDIKARFPALHVLVHNAGVFMNERVVTVDGLEATLAINHVAPFLLTHLLLDLLKKSAPARVITISSIAHTRAKLDFGNLQWEKAFEGYGAYALSKLANVLFTVELARRLQGTGVTANCLHPGVIATKLLQIGFGNMKAGSVEKGAETPVYLAASPEVEGVTGGYFVDSKEAHASPAAEDSSLCRRFWETSLQLAGIAPHE
jgi:retinol dehydrogenase 14